MKGMSFAPLRRFALSALVLGSFVEVRAQYVPLGERGQPAARRYSVLDTNTVRSTFYNFGFGGRMGVGQGMAYEWPKGTNRDYLALVTMFVGGEVIDANGDTIHIVSVPAFRTNPQTGLSWNFEPVPDYQNAGSNELARSDEPSTWPSTWIDKLNDPTDPGWPGSWNGLLGKNVFINGTELYHHYADNLYNRYRYYPIPSDTTRRGLGIVVSQRTLAWREPFLEDAIVTVSDIFNVGSQTIQRAGVTMWIADFLGGDGDSQDDLMSYNLPRKTLYFKDRDGLSVNPAFANARVLMPALTFLQTPQTGGVELGMTNIQYLPAGAINFSQTSDVFFWNTFMRPGDYIDPQLITVGDYDAFASASYFTLPAHGSRRFVTSIVFAEDSLNTNRKVNYLRGLVGGGFTTNSVSVSIISPQPGQVLSGQVPIQWTVGAGRQSLKLDIFCSSNAGGSWRLISEGELNDGGSILNTDTLSDGIFYKLMLVAYDSLGLGSAIMDSTCIINNPPPSPPQIRLMSPLTGQVWQSEIPLRWQAGDPDGDTVTVDLFYDVAGAGNWTSLVAGLPNTGHYTLDISSLPNSRMYSLKAIAHSGDTAASDSSGQFEIRNPRYGLSESAFVQRNTVGTGLIQAHIVTPAQVTGHTYNVMFVGPSDSATSYNVFDENTSSTVVSGATQMTGVVEGPLFDGIRLLIRTDGGQVDQMATGWRRQGIHNPVFELYRYDFEQGSREMKDYYALIGNVGMDTSNAAFAFGIQLASRFVNFTVRDAASNVRVPFAFLEIDGNDGRFTASSSTWSDYIVLLRRFNPDSLGPTWMVWMSPDLMANPIPGDTLVVRLRKPFQNEDTYRFTALAGGLLNVRDQSPHHFILSQNFPNPFNPQTEIRFSLGSMQHVELQVYDILGRVVQTLVRERLDPGEHAVRWDGKNEKGLSVSTGVYFYRLAAGAFVQTKKMVLLR